MAGWRVGQRWRDEVSVLILVKTNEFGKRRRKLDIFILIHALLQIPAASPGLGILLHPMQKI